jgi:hypothetical protein
MLHDHRPPELPGHIHGAGNFPAIASLRLTSCAADEADGYQVWCQFLAVGIISDVQDWEYMKLFQKMCPELAFTVTVPNSIELLREIMLNGRRDATASEEGIGGAHERGSTIQIPHRLTRAVSRDRSCPRAGQSEAGSALSGVSRGAHFSGSTIYIATSNFFL